MSKRISFQVEGVVQGVNFRSWTVQKATQVQVTGFVKNADDGSVVGEAQGSESNIAKFVQHISMGPGPAEVDSVVQKELGVRDGESGFVQDRS